jgi:hypothetical protein
MNLINNYKFSIIVPEVHIKKEKKNILLNKYIYTSFTEHWNINHPEQKYVLVKLNNQTGLERGVTEKAKIQFLSLPNVRLWTAKQSDK